MKIHSVCLIKNEADIITQTLSSAVKWCDFIYVYDNGSTDGTWEKVLELAKDYKQIVPYKQESKPYNDSLRSEAFNHYRANSSEGDWWCLLDADEIYIDDPQIFLSKIPQKYQVVWAASFQYYFTDKDLVLYNQNPSLYADDVPVEEKCHYYINNWSEARFFKYRKNLVWNKYEYPNSPGASYSVRIRLKHFQYRSPQQIQKRLDTRLQAMSNGIFWHEVQANWKAIVEQSKTSSEQNENYFPPSWKERVVEASKLLYDVHDGRYIVDENALPKITTIRPSLSKRIINKVGKLFHL